MSKVAVIDHHQLTKGERKEYIDFLTRIQLHGLNCAICGRPFTEQDIHTAITGPTLASEVCHAKCYEEYLERNQA